jgi:hypothetical protein
MVFLAIYVLAGIAVAFYLPSLLRPLDYNSYIRELKMKLPVMKCFHLSDRGQPKKEEAGFAPRHAQHCNARMCEHQVLPMLSHALASPTILGWACVFCNEQFENYPVAHGVENTVETLAG